MNRIIFCLTGFLVVGCTLDNRIETDALCDSQFGYCVALTTTMMQRGWTDNWTGVSGQPTAHTVSNGLPPDDADYVRMDIYHTSPSPHCGNTGVLHPTLTIETNSERTFWGKVDEVYSDGDLSPNCYTRSIYGQAGPYSASYVLCSEKDGKTVFICMMQVQDNLALAEQIFSTFRWIEP